MHWVLKKYQIAASRDQATERRAVIETLLDLLSSDRDTVNLNALAEWWLDLIRPVWNEHLKNRRRTSPALLRHIRQDLVKSPLSNPQLNSIR